MQQNGRENLVPRQLKRAIPDRFYMLGVVFCDRAVVFREKVSHPDGDPTFERTQHFAFSTLAIRHMVVRMEMP
ncbi:hypothetical protein IFU01_18655 [Oxalobacteraceae sp. CFBP 8763]|jgi:hypothetical protein|uniref:Uncharacterized protein n=1 Tax=Massilia aurea TaxID=373040 RepID=A0A7W9X1R1_9BURK|nr:hypothetical protein [Massilia aurea]MBB6134872.1 hypothetical protein [Massilia aurea]MBD8566283.1 hypothetical protein [Oxalobacteraceae sp. CFBP 8763]RZA25430.1 MAG: hypothetical protein EOP02_12290 [Pseudomonadota bacterium]